MEKYLLLFVAAFLLAGCTTTNTPSPSPTALPTQAPTVSTIPNATIQEGDLVSVLYVGRLEDGTVFDSNVKEIAQKAGINRPQYDLLTFQVGAGQMIAGFDQALVGMRVNEKKTVTIPPEQAYGQKSPELIKTFPLKDLESLGAKPQVGLTVSAANGAVGNVTAVNETDVTVDFNHRLSGKTLIFEITLVKAQRRAQGAGNAIG